MRGEEDKWDIGGRYEEQFVGNELKLEVNGEENRYSVGWVHLHRMGVERESDGGA